MVEEAEGSAGADQKRAGSELHKIDKSADKTASYPGQRAVPALPDRSAEELDLGWGERARDVDRRSEDDERLLRERPPHWE